MDDALQESHVPKIDDDYCLYIVRGQLQPRQGRLDTLELTFRARYLVTHHDTPISAVDRIWA